MLKKMKKDLWNILCVFWAMAVALFWFSMRVIWSGISKVLYEAMGKKEPTAFLLNLPLYVSIFLWVLAAFAVAALVRKGRKKRAAITLTVLLGIFTVVSAVEGVMGAIDYLYFILPKFFLSLLIGLCIAAFALCDDMLINLFLMGEGSAADAAGILACGREYLKVMLWGLLPFAVSTAYATTLRECGETLVPMISSFAAMFCNLILNYILIFGHWGAPAMGVAGAAIATVISRFFELAIVAVWAHSHKVKFPFIQGLYRSLRIPGKLMKQMMTKAAPLILNEALWSIAITFQNQCYSTCGLAVVSALNIVTTLNNMATVAASAIGIVAALMFLAVIV